MIPNYKIEMLGMRFGLGAAWVGLGAALGGCSSDDSPSEPEVFSVSGAFPNTEDDYESGPIGPGDSYEFTFEAEPGMRLSFASMFVESNDWFVGASDAGLELFDDEGEPVTGDVSNSLQIWDAGTEKNETPGEGENQPMRQPKHDVGPADPDENVRVLSDYDAGDFIRLELSFDDGTFSVTMTNVSDDADVATPFGPGVFVVHERDFPLFREGSPDSGQGLEALAEDGDPSILLETVEERTGTE